MLAANEYQVSLLKGEVRLLTSESRRARENEPRDAMRSAKARLQAARSTLPRLAKRLRQQDSRAGSPMHRQTRGPLQTHPCRSPNASAAEPLRTNARSNRPLL